MLPCECAMCFNIKGENDVLFQKVTQSYSEKNPSAPIRSMPVSLSGIINHSHSFTRLEIYHHIYLILKVFD